MPGPPLTERRDPIGALARLDRRVVPVLQRASRGVVRGLAWPLRAVARLEDRAAPRLVRLGLRSWRGVALAAALIATLGSAVHLQRYPDLQEERRAAAERPGGRTALPGERSADDDSGELPVVGPTVGADAGDHIAERTDVLSSLPPEETRLAVVSLAAYRTAEDVAVLLPPDLEVHLVQYRVPAEGERPLQTEVPDGDLVAAVDRAVDAAVEPIVEEIGEVRRLLESGTVDDPAYEDDLERRLSELQAVRNVLDASGAVAFAVVVQGPVSSLVELAQHDDVRLVDPAPEGTDVAGTVFYGLLPEETGAVSFGAPA